MEDCGASSLSPPPDLSVGPGAHWQPQGLRLTLQVMSPAPTGSRRPCDVELEQVLLLFDTRYSLSNCVCACVQVWIAWESP